MSSYFHSAAMTLLSKTLQTLLYKYLSDVDVEGVALPSLYNTDGHSGWGVRLSNVKLREGAKLMDLPGRIAKEGEKAKEDGEDEGEEELNDQASLKSKAAISFANEDTLDPSSVHIPEFGEEVSEEADPSNAGPPPPPIPEKLSSSWFSWGYRRSKSEGAPATVAEETYANEDVAPIHALSVTEHVVSEPPLSGNLDDRLLLLEDNTGSQHTAHSRFMGDDASRKSKSDPPPSEPPMRLRLGQQGTIGILDVRLVGKDLHVVVEDADLTVEVVRITTAGRKREEEANKEKAPKAKPTKKQTPDPETVGDRILAENSLAKLFSIIPNLFLRDIRVKLIIRDEPVDEADSTAHESPNDTVVELNIELLSVTDGEDFFAHVREEDEEASTDAAGDYEDHNMSSRVAPTINPEGEFTQNEYLTKRIRTGRGPEGGIVLKIYPGETYIDSHVNDPKWARQTWYSSADWCVMRCSGLDVHARIFMGTMKELQVMSSTADWYAEEYDEYTVDSMLFGGVDYIAPGPQPPLPPMPENEPLEAQDEGQLWTLPGATTYRIDANGIQSSFVNTSFHRVARGLRPRTCTLHHLPCEYCDQCWEAPPGVPLSHSYDLAGPLGGLVVSLMIRDPLEINVDRPTLEIIGCLIQLFTKPSTKKTPSTERESSVQADDPDDITASETFDSNAPLKRSISNLSRNSQTSMEAAVTAPEDDPVTLRGRKSTSYRLPETNEVDEEDEEEDEGPSGNSEDFDDISSAFPSYMSPEKVQYAGAYVQEIVFRVHLMRKESVNEKGFGFRFWQLLAKCITIDQQGLSGDITPYGDTRLDCGFFTVTSFVGNQQRLMASLGVRQRVVEFDEATVETLMTRERDCERPPWPATSTVLLDIPPPLESLVYESRDRHAFQIRFVSLLDSQNGKSRSSAHIKLGNTNIEMPYASIGEISAAVKEARNTISPPTQTKPAVPASSPRTELEPKIERLMKYRLQCDGAHVLLEPFIDARLPMSSLSGDRSSSTGIRIESVLEKLQFRYGRKHIPTIMDDRLLSLERLARLPEQLRMRILLCLDNLNPLAQALGMKSEENSFLRCRSINKRIVRVANKKKKRPSLLLEEQISRRQYLMQELNKLDDDELEDLYEAHTRRQRRHARNQQNH